MPAEVRIQTSRLYVDTGSFACADGGEPGNAAGNAWMAEPSRGGGGANSLGCSSANGALVNTGSRDPGDTGNRDDEERRKHIGMKDSSARTVTQREMGGATRSDEQACHAPKEAYVS